MYGHHTWRICRSPLIFERNRWPRGELEGEALSHYALTHRALARCYGSREAAAKDTTQATPAFVGRWKIRKRRVWHRAIGDGLCPRRVGLLLVLLLVKK